MIAGSLYALVAVGFTLTYKVTRFMNFAHGAVVMLGAFIFYYAHQALPFSLAVLATLALTGLLGWVTDAACYAPLRRKDSSNAVLLIASVALFILLQNLALALFGADIKSVRKGSSQAINFIGGTITPIQAWIVAAAAATLLATWFLMKKTKTGKSLRAVADNKELAETTGINAERAYSLSFVIASVIAGVASVLAALEYNVEPNMGFLLIIRGFTGSVVGGINSVPGAVLGSVLLGLVENIGIWFLPSSYKDAIAFTLLFVFLLFKPSGLLGVEKGVKG